MKSLKQEKQRTLNFTLMELLVAVAVIAILIGLLLPALNAARAKAHSITCMSQWKQIGTAMVNYANDSDDYAPFCMQKWSDRVDYMHSWIVMLWPYTGHQDFSTFYSARPGIFLCPAAKTEEIFQRTKSGTVYAITSYGWNIYCGSWTGGANNHGFYSEIRMAKRLSANKRSSLAFVGSDGKMSTSSDEKNSIEIYDTATLNAKVSSRHPGLTDNALYADGHAASYSKNGFHTNAMIRQVFLFENSSGNPYWK